MNAHTRLSGRYKVVKIKGDSVVEELDFPNIVTDVGLERWGTGDIGGTCFIGSGNTAPSVSDTGLAALIASSGNKDPFSRAYSVAERWVEVTMKYRFTLGYQVNSIAEVGVGWSGGLWSRALIRDGLGNPTTIQLLADEVLDVYYTLRLQFPATDVTGSITLDGVAYDWVMRPAGLSHTPQDAYRLLFYSFGGYGLGSGAGTASSAGMTAVDTQPSNHAYCSSSSVAAYVAGSRTQRMTILFDLNNANFGIKSVCASVAGAGTYATVTWQLGFYQAGVPVGVPKTSNKRLSLTFEFSWGRA